MSSPRKKKPGVSPPTTTSKPVIPPSFDGSRSSIRKSQLLNNPEEDLEGTDTDEDEGTLRSDSSSCSPSDEEENQIIGEQGFISDDNDSVKWTEQILDSVQVMEKNSVPDNDQRFIPVGGLTTPESKRQKFHVYLKKSGLLTAIAKSILALLDCEQYPPVDECPEFIANQLGYSLTIRNDIAEIKEFNSQLLSRIQAKKDENDILRRRLDEFESSETPIEYLDPDEYDSRLSPDYPPKPLELNRRELKLKRKNPIVYDKAEKRVLEDGISKIDEYERQNFKKNCPLVNRDENILENLHGKEIGDPYRWLEDCDSEQVNEFVRDQNTLTMSYLDKCPQKNEIRGSLRKLLNYERRTCPARQAGRYFYFGNSGLQNQSVLFVQEKLGGTSKILVDPNNLSEDETVTISAQTVSENGKILAYALSKSGSNWKTIYFRDVDTGRDYEDVLSKTKFTDISWTHDHKGVFYSWYPTQKGKTDGSETTMNSHEKLYYHVLGTCQEDDILIAEFPDHPKWFFGGIVSDCGNYLTIKVGYEFAKNSVFYIDISKGVPLHKTKLMPIISSVDLYNEYITNDGHHFYFRTNKNAPNFRMVRINLDDPVETKWVDIVSENPDSVLTSAYCIDKDKLILIYIEDVKNKLTLVHLKDGSKIHDFHLEVGSILELTGSPHDSEFFFKFSSFVTPGRIYRIDLKKPVIEAEIFHESKIRDLNPSNFTTAQVFYPSKDGTLIPMFLVHRKDLPLNGDNLCLLYGYGGFNYSNTPHYFPFFTPFIRNLDGVLAIANIRGGGEYGEAWHSGGTQLNKQNGFDDFISAAEYLIQNGFTHPSKLVIRGASNGGFLVAAVTNQRPELFGGVIAEVGVMDLIRFHNFTIGYCWTSDYGHPDDPEHFENLLKLSPLHNVRVPENGQYPAMLLLTADHDDRVVPLHSYKMIATLQHKIGKLASQTNPLMLRIYTKAGHGAGVSLEKRIEENTDIISFVVCSMNVKYRA